MMNFIVNEFFLRRTENSFYLDRQTMFNKLLLKVLQLIIVNRVERVVIFFMYSHNLFIGYCVGFKTIYFTSL